MRIMYWDALAPAQSLGGCEIAGLRWRGTGPGVLRAGPMWRRTSGARLISPSTASARSFTVNLVAQVHGRCLFLCPARQLLPPCRKHPVFLLAGLAGVGRHAGFYPARRFHGGRARGRSAGAWRARSSRWICRNGAPGRSRTRLFPAARSVRRGRATWG